ncbi:MAG: hypothetical protein AAGA56_01190 [Myxococcota bacterium]
MACATIASNGGGETALPNAAAGPFREATSRELPGRAAPFALRNDDEFDRDVSVVDQDNDEATVPAFVFAARTNFSEDVDSDASAPSNAIVRFVAPDGRTPDRQFTPVYEPTAPWEGEHVGAPAGLWSSRSPVGAPLPADALLLFYEAEGGIGVLVEGEPVEGPVLAPAESGWDVDQVPRSPAPYIDAAGELRLLYVADLPDGRPAIGEAVADGTSLVRRAEPVLQGSEDRDPGGVDGPAAVAATTAIGRDVTYLYYGGIEADGSRSIGLAARFFDGQPFTKAPSPVLRTDDLPREPWVVRGDGFSVLYVTSDAGTSGSFPGVLVGVAPADISLAP